MARSRSTPAASGPPPCVPTSPARSAVRCRTGIRPCTGSDCRMCPRQSTRRPPRSPGSTASPSPSCRHRLATHRSPHPSRSGRCLHRPSLQSERRCSLHTRRRRHNQRRQARTSAPSYGAPEHGSCQRGHSRFAGKLSGAVCQSVPWPGGDDAFGPRLSRHSSVILLLNERSFRSPCCSWCVRRATPRQLADTVELGMADMRSRIRQVYG